jgi:membrane protein implicated in regulation of membrane protease activity
MLHAPGQALTAIVPGGTGRVATHGEIWTATSADSIHAGDRVVVTAVNGLLLTVRRA